MILLLFKQKIYKNINKYHQIKVNITKYHKKLINPRVSFDMATYDARQKERLLEFPIPVLLKHFGKRTDHEGKMYFSPFREETRPSMHVDPVKNIWMDFGSGEGGNVLTLASMLQGISMADAWDFLAGLDPDVKIDSRPYRSSRSSTSTVITVDEVCPSFASTALKGYAQSRGIPLHILNRYCRQVRYHIGDSRNIFNAIGFPTADGWVMRHAGQAAGKAKRCTGCQCTFLDVSGALTACPTSDRVEVFEGFFDFLSWLVIKDKTKPFSDICVLNSVNNLRRGMAFISAHSCVSAWMDNDEAGIKALESLRSACPNVISHTAELEGVKDVNDLLMKNRKEAIVNNNSKQHKLFTPKH